MVPLRLHLHNFLSYGDSGEPIEFDGIHVACLCGPNGHGKSALLDAITWALWGQARSNTADDLIRLGQQNMLVEFEFLLDGQRYRVIRKRSRTRAGQSDLQFQVRQEDGDWRALTGQGVRDTQARITQTLRMDYDTFINSAFILQGRADEFARKSPGDRKRILGEILSLSVYDQLCDAARAQRSEAQTRVRSLEAEIHRMEAERAQEPAQRAEVERLTAEHAEALLGCERARAELQELLVEKARLDARRKERDDLARRLAGAEAELKVQRGLLAGAERRVEAAEARVARAVDIRARAQELAELSRERDETTARLNELRGLDAERGRYQRELQQEEHALNTQLQLARERVRETQALADQWPKMQRELADLEAQAAVLDRLHDERTAIHGQLQALAAEHAEAQAEGRRCADDLVKAEERFKLLKGAHAVCPLCEGALPDDKRKELGWKLRQEMEALKAGREGAVQRQAESKKAEAEAQRRARELDGKLKTGQLMRDRLAQVRQRHLHVEEATRQLPGKLAVAQGLETQLQSGAFGAEVRAALADVDARIRAVQYDEARYHAVTAALGKLAGADR
jgi:exonuclease SbcC